MCILRALLSTVLLAAAAIPAPPPARFRQHTVATGLKGGYQTLAVDLNKDGKPDLIALASGLPELLWFENPGWERRVIVSGLSGAINAAAWDTDGDGIPEIGLAQEFSSDPRKSAGAVSVLRRAGDPRQPWSAREIDRLATSHRLRWADIDGNGRKVLVNAPLAGVEAVPPAYHGPVPLVFYRPGQWKRETITTFDGVFHGIFVADWDRRGREDILTASFEGIHLVQNTPEGWRRRELAKGNLEARPRMGASDVDTGRLSKGRFLCAIEPWHGNQLVVYTLEGHVWRRNALDDTLVDGHALAAADLNGDGVDEIIAGFRGKGHRVSIYYAEDAAGMRWSRSDLDKGDMAAASCAAADLNGDGRTDIACIGTATANLKWYENY